MSEKLFIPASSTISCLCLSCLCFLLIIFFAYNVMKTGETVATSATDIGTALAQNPEALKTIAQIAPFLLV